MPPLPWPVDLSPAELGADLVDRPAHLLRRDVDGGAELARSRRTSMHPRPVEAHLTGDRRGG
jgi:hypothetical protein